MSKKIIYRNNLGVELEITNAAPLLLQDFETSNSINIYKNKGMCQDGATYLGNTLDVKDINVKIMLLAENKIELIKLRNKINKVFNPKVGEGYLIYKDDLKEFKIKCIVNRLPYFEANKGNSFQTCLLSLTASSPHWQQLEETKTEIALWKGSFEFPLEIIEEGIEMGYREPSLIVNVLNNGDVESGMRIEFKALATLKNPSLINVNTREFVKVNKTMVAGEKLYISTYFGNKRVDSNLNGITTNAFNYIDFQSTFLQLSVGDNLFRYDAETNLDNLEVTIYHNNNYLDI